MPRGVRKPKDGTTEAATPAKPNPRQAIALVGAATVKPAQIGQFARKVQARIDQLTQRLAKVEAQNVEYKKKVRQLTIDLRNANRQLTQFSQVINGVVDKTKTTRNDRELAIDQTDFGQFAEGGAAGTPAADLGEDEEL